VRCATGSADFDQHLVSKPRSYEVDPICAKIATRFAPSGVILRPLEVSASQPQDCRDRWQDAGSSPPPEGP
jgi:hypothetical protein